MAFYTEEQQVSSGITSIGVQGSPPIEGGVILTAGAGISLIQSGQDITIATSGSGFLTAAGSITGAVSQIQVFTYGITLSNLNTGYIPYSNSSGHLINSQIYNDGNGHIGIGTVSPSAQLHLAAGSGTAGTASQKLTSGTLLVTPEDGALEYGPTHLYFTIGSSRFQLDQQSVTGPNFSDGEIPGGTINGTNVTFTLAHSPGTSLHLYLNGLRLLNANDYSISGSTITFTSAPKTGDEILADYRY